LLVYIKIEKVTDLNMFILLIIYTFFVFIRPQEYIPVFSKIPFMPVILVMLVIGLFMSKEKNFHFPQDKFLIGFFIMTILSHLFHAYISGAYEVAVKFLPIILLYFIMTHTLTSMERLEKYFIVLVILALIMAAHGIHQFFNEGIGWTGQTFADKTTRIRYIGIFSDPNDLSLVFIFTIPLAIYFIYKNSGALSKFVNIAAIITLIYAITLTSSRGAMVSLGAMVAYYAVRRYGIKKGIIAGVILSIPVLILFAKGNFLEISTEEESAAGRIDAWYEGLQMLIHSPLWGVGVGMFTDYNYLTAHNSFVLCFAETGLIGYFLWLGAIYFNFTGLARSINYELMSEEEGTILSSSFFLTISLIGFLTASFFLSRTYTIILYMNMGIISSYLYIKEKELDWSFYQGNIQKDLLNITGVMFLSIIIIFFFVRFSV
jgi:O-antigen ligase